MLLRFELSGRRGLLGGDGHAVALLAEPEPIFNPRGHSGSHARCHSGSHSQGVQEEDHHASADVAAGAYDVCDCVC